MSRCSAHIVEQEKWVVEQLAGGRNPRRDLWPVGKHISPIGMTHRT